MDKLPVEDIPVLAVGTVGDTQPVAAVDILAVGAVFLCKVEVSPTLYPSHSFRKIWLETH